jgi:hypothetical protein
MASSKWAVNSRNCVPFGFLAVTKSAAIAALSAVSLSSDVLASETYEVRVQCPDSNGYETVYVHADDDMDATNQAQKLMLTRTDYKRKKCFVIEIKRR